MPMLTTARQQPGTSSIWRKDTDETFLTAVAQSGEETEDMLRRAIQVARRNGGTVVSQTVFGASDARIVDTMREEVDWPVTWLSADPETAPPATQIHVISGTPVRRVRIGDRPVASVYEDGVARWCKIGGLRPDHVSGPREEQARHTFRALRRVLENAELNVRDTFRTWLYLDGILGWYGPFNGVRDEFFRWAGMFDGLVPASTGVGTANPHRAGLVAEALAMRPVSEAVSVRAVDSPLQCSALDYGSSFSRAVEVMAPGHRRLYVSGTASIDGKGRTCHKGDFEAQMDLTLRTVEAILHSREMGWGDTVRAVAYFPRPDDLPALTRRLGRLDLPAAVVPAVVCRDDLLFELELDAIHR
jgi:enamine deaminase RidA (YjgF/YER057c/UK114 family)